MGLDTSWCANRLVFTTSEAWPCALCDTMGSVEETVLISLRMERLGVATGRGWKFSRRPRDWSLRIGNDRLHSWNCRRCRWLNSRNGGCLFLMQRFACVELWSRRPSYDTDLLPFKACWVAVDVSV
jgi:hypothetical protein